MPCRYVALPYLFYFFVDRLTFSSTLLWLCCLFRLASHPSQVQLLCYYFFVSFMTQNRSWWTRQWKVLRDNPDALCCSCCWLQPIQLDMFTRDKANDKFQFRNSIFCFLSIIRQAGEGRVTRKESTDNRNCSAVKIVKTATWENFN